MSRIALSFALLLGFTGCPVRKEAADSAPFLWVAAAPDGSGVLLRWAPPPEDFPVVAGLDVHRVPRAEWTTCYAGPIEPVLAAARRKGRIEHMELAVDEDSGEHRLSVWHDDLRSPMTAYRYSCGAGGVSPTPGGGRR